MKTDCLWINDQVRKGLEGPAKDGETVTLEQIDTDDENDEVKQHLDYFFSLVKLNFCVPG